MKKTIIISILLASVFHLSAQQTFQWAVKAGGERTDVINDITSIDNNIYATGRFSGTFSSGNEKEEGKTRTDIYLMKLDQKGNTDWLQSLTSEGTNSVSRISSNNETIYQGGIISGTVSQNKNQFIGEGKAVFIASWNKKGKINWLSRIPFSGNATLDVLEVAPDGKIFAGGMISGYLIAGDDTISSGSGRRAYTATFSTEGNLTETILSEGKGDNRLVAAKFGNNGIRYLFFNTHGWMSYGDNPALFKQDEKFKGLVLIKETKNKTNWVKYIKGDGYLQGVQLAVNNQNQVSACMNYSKTITLTDTVLSTSALQDVAIINYNSNGDRNWFKQLKSPVVCYAMETLQTNNEKLLITGYFRDIYSFGDSQILADNDNPNESMFLVQLDKNGNLLWHDQPGEQASAFGKTVAIGSRGDIYMAGGFKNEVSFNSEKLKSAGKEDILIAKYFNCEQLEVNIDQIGPLCKGTTVELTISDKNFETFLWNDSIWEETFTTSHPGTYYVEAFDLKGCSAKDTIEIEWSSSPTLGLPEEVSLTRRNEIMLTANDGFADYLWNEGSSGSNLVINFSDKTDSTAFVLTAETFEGCSVFDTTIVHFITNENLNTQFYSSFFQVYPNPVNDKLSWFYKTKEPQDISVKLFDGKGVMVYQKEIGNYIPNSVQYIDMQGMVSGNYMLSLTIGENSFNEKIIKN